MAIRRSIKADALARELHFRASTSSGPGGQNVNKVNSKVTLKFDIPHSEELNDEEKELILKKLASRVTKEGILILSAQEKRSQLRNKEMVIGKLEKLLAKALTRKKFRKATKPSKGAVHERLKAKKQHADKKKWRQKP